MDSDVQLAAAAKAGSDAAFAELVERYQERLLRFLLTRCASHADAEDALQDTFINAYRYLHSFDPRWRFSTWIYRIGIRNAMRQKPPESAAQVDPIDASADPLNDCIVASEHENLWLAAKRVLTEDAYTALWLRYVEDLSIRDVAVALDRSVSWTKVTLLRARRKLADVLPTNRSAEKGARYG
ncbi:MAG: sigma-70 family RNA polymerase sigma factor [Gammaproteobacteria bacterium]|nr:sigma-70 family RNA polymerase sigma factor [Gammaproteobacteria bacterium]